MTLNRLAALRLLAAGPLLVLSVACGSSNPPQAEPTQTATPTTSPTASPTPTPEPPKQATSVVFRDRDDLYIYDVAGNAVRPLVSDGPKMQEYSPIFTDEGTVTYASGNRVFEVDIATQAKREISRFPGEVNRIAWSPDRHTLAVLYQRSTDSEVRFVLRLAAFGGGESRDIKVFKPWGGRGGSDDDDVHLEWSPDGSRIIAVMTPLDTAPDNTMYVLDRNGKDLAAPRMGTMARWGADSGTVIYRDYGGDKRAWHSLDLGTGKVRDLAMTAGTVRPALSPDRTLIAYDDAQGKPTIYVFDLVTGRERKLATGSLAAVWLSDDSLAATVVRPCVPATNCEGNWVHEMRAVRVSLADGASRPITLRSTFDAAAFIK